MNERNYFTAPCLWDEQKEQEIMDIIPQNGRKLTELYGTVPMRSLSLVDIIKFWMK